MMLLCISRKYPYSPHRRDWNFLGEEGSIRPNFYKTEFPEGWGGVRQNPFCGGGMDIFWNYTINDSTIQVPILTASGCCCRCLFPDRPVQWSC